ncbi:MAG TPA: hypothetical protein VK395_38055 [Gemmataceae bacterium]|nr:hypothetical protein [Gemmataceae bacterium]
MGIPDPKSFFLEIPPYAGFQFDTRACAEVLRVKFYTGTLDAHCMECQERSVFRSKVLGFCRPEGPVTRTETWIEVSVDELIKGLWPRVYQDRQGTRVPVSLSAMEEEALKERVFNVEFTCARNPNHSLYFIFRVQNKTITKIGQSPSLADLHEAGTSKYRKVLGDDKYREFTKGIGLNAHGVGIGAFVYLRRIFEDLVEKSHAEARKESGWDENGYAHARMEDKIVLLKDKLPGPLIEFKAIYPILGKGIHELSEEQCLEIFTPLRLSIELILDEERQRRERATKLTESRNAIAKIKGSLGKSESGSPRASP